MRLKITMKEIIAVLFLSTCVASGLNTGTEDEERWFNGLHGPNIYFGSHNFLGQHEQETAENDDYNGDEDHRHHRHYVNLKACECVDVIDTKTPTKRSLDTYPTVGNDERHLVNLYNNYYFQFGRHHNHGGHFENHGGSSSASSSDESIDDYKDVHLKPQKEDDSDSRESSPIIAPVEYYPNAKKEYVHYRRNFGFRNPFTGKCICSSAPSTHASVTHPRFSPTPTPTMGTTTTTTAAPKTMTTTTTAAPVTMTSTSTSAPKTMTSITTAAPITMTSTTTAAPTTMTSTTAAAPTTMTSTTTATPITMTSTTTRPPRTWHWYTDATGN